MALCKWKELVWGRRRHKAHVQETKRDTTRQGGGGGGQISVRPSSRGQESWTRLNSVPSCLTDFWQWGIRKHWVRREALYISRRETHSHAAASKELHTQINKALTQQKYYVLKAKLAWGNCLRLLSQHGSLKTFRKQNNCFSRERRPERRLLADEKLNWIYFHLLRAALHAKQRLQHSNPYKGWWRSVWSLCLYFWRNFSARSAASSASGWLATARFTTCSQWQ